MKNIISSVFASFLIVSGIQLTMAQDDEARAASGLPTLIGRRACTNPVGNADANLSGSIEIQGMPQTEKEPNITVLVMANGIVYARERVKNRSSFGFTCIPRTGITISLEVNNIEIANSPVGTLSPPPMSNRKDIVLTWIQVANVVKQRNEVINLRNSHQRTSDNQKAFEKAVEGLKGKKRGESVSQFREIVEKDPADFVAWTELGNLYFGGGEFSEAESAYGKALALKPDFVPAQMNLGKCYLSQKKNELAVEIFMKILATSPDLADAHHYLGEAYLAAKKGSKAVIHLNRAIELAPTEKAELHLRLALLYNAAGMKERAAAEYRSFLEKMPSHPDKEKLQQYIAANGSK